MPIKTAPYFIQERLILGTTCEDLVRRVRGESARTGSGCQLLPVNIVYYIRRSDEQVSGIVHRKHSS